MSKIVTHLDFLGFPVRDRVTGFSGVVSSVCFDLYGCIQYGITPIAGDDGKLGDSHWFDEKRIEKTAKKPVMVARSFDGDIIGPAAKPHGRSLPVR